MKNFVFIIPLLLLILGCGGKGMTPEQLEMQRLKMEEMRKEREIKIDARKDTLHYEAFSDKWRVVSSQTHDHTICKYLLVHVKDTVRKKALFANCDFLSVNMVVQTCLSKETMSRINSQIITRDSMYVKNRSD